VTGPVPRTGPTREGVIGVQGVLLIFLDGVGIGPADADVNPFLATELPALEALLGSVPSLVDPTPRSSASGREAVVIPVDATLGVEGTPQSGTGHAALLTGRNAAREFGRHFGPWVPTSLRDTVREESLLARAVREGRQVGFANAYPRGWPGERTMRRVAGFPLAALGAGVLTRHVEHLAGGEAVASEIVNDGWIRHLGPADLPRPTAAEAGRTLAGIASRAELTVFAHYGTDTAGHRREMRAATDSLRRVDDFLAGVLAELPADHRLLVVSDHGNLEDIRGGHTRNPALGLLVGAAGRDGMVRRVPPRLSTLTDVPGVVGELLGGG